jgi:putative endonuclease
LGLFLGGRSCAFLSAMATRPRRFVYVLRSGANPARHYVGLTAHLRERLVWHNMGPRGYTTDYRPWRLLVCLEFTDESTARRFERYLKTGSGRAFAKRHFAPDDKTIR